MEIAFPYSATSHGDVAEAKQVSKKTKMNLDSRSMDAICVNKICVSPLNMVDHPCFHSGLCYHVAHPTPTGVLKSEVEVRKSSLGKKLRSVKRGWHVKVSVGQEIAPFEFKVTTIGGYLTIILQQPC